MKYSYFVSFMFLDKYDVRNYGNESFESSRRIDSLAHINVMQEKIKEKHDVDGEVIIINYKLMKHRWYKFWMV